jgi:hypothetical protein
VSCPQVGRRGAPFIVGATALLAGYLPPGGRIGNEGPLQARKIRFMVVTALVLIAVGLVFTGYRCLRWVPMRPCGGRQPSEPIRGWTDYWMP